MQSPALAAAGRDCCQSVSILDMGGAQQPCSLKRSVHASHLSPNSRKKKRYDAFDVF